MARGIQEAIRIVLETEGREGIEALRTALAGIGDVSADTVADTDRLLDSLSGLHATAAKAARFGELTGELHDTTRALDEASHAALQLSLQLAETDRPSREMQRTFQQARAEVTRLEDVQRRQAASVERVAAELHAAGVDTRDMAVANQLLRAEIGGVNAALARQVGTVEQQAAATRRQREAVRDADEAFRRLARSGQVSAEALRQYRERIEQARAGTAGLEGAVARTRGIFGSLRGVLATAAGYLGLTSAVDGVKRLLEVGAAAETSRRSLQNLYGSQEAGNRAFRELEVIAKRNGIAFQDVTAIAKQMKAFGLDPLNGSLQALIDQNAAVGGSNADLEGKVLALGQAWAKQKLQGEEILQLVERGVPVWDLLQKATGKNVAELQKLSEQGKLGRDVIAALYTEIGKANAGAAQAGLSGLSGLLAQVTARWTEFLGKVADAGVTEYFKKQIQSLLGSSGDLDAVARRVAAGIVGMLEQVRKTGEQLAPLARLVGTVTGALTRHAEVIALTVKAWALFRLAEYAAGFARVTTSVTATTAAILAQRAAVAGAAGAAAAQATAAAGAFTTLGARIASVATGLLGLARVAALPLAIIGTADALGRAYQNVVAQMASLDAAEARVRSHQADGIRLGRELQALYKQYAATVILSSQQIGAQTKAQAQDYLVALQNAQTYYRGVVKEAVNAGQGVDPEIRAALQRIDAAINATTGHLKALKAEAARSEALTAFATAAVAKFDEIATKSKSAKEAVSGIFKGVDLKSSEGLKNVASILEQVSARGKDAAAAIQNELRGTLAGVTAEDLPALEARAVATFGAASAEAKAFASAIQSVRADKLGVDLEAVKTGMTAAGREAVTLFRQMVGEVDNLGLNAQQKSQVIATAFDNAFRQASTKAELQALKQALQDALSAGDIGFQEFQQRIAQTDAKMAELGGTGKQLGSDVAQGASQAASSLGQVADAAGDAAKGVDDAGKASAEAGDKMEKGAEQARSFGLTMSSVSAEFNRAAAAINKYAGTRLWAEMLNDVTARHTEQAKAVQDEMAALDAELAKYDEMSAAVEQLRAQYNYLGDDQLRALAEKRKQLADMEKREREAQQQALQEQQRAAQAASQSAAGEAAGAAQALGQAAQAAARAATAATAATAAASRPVATAANLPQLGTIHLEIGDVRGDLITDANGAELVRRMVDELARSKAVTVRRRR